MIGFTEDVEKGPSQGCGTWGYVISETNLTSRICCPASSKTVTMRPFVDVAMKSG